MRFFCITNQKNPTTTSLLKDACDKRGIELQEIFPEEFDFSASLPVETKDLLYRVSDAQEAKNLEKLFLSKHPTTFYASPIASLLADAPIMELMLLQKQHIPMPKTVFGISKTKNFLRNSAQELGEFPIIIKALGHSHGIGVMRIDSFPSLFSVTDFLLKDNEPLVMRKFVDTNTSARLIVLGNSVIDSIEYRASENDFRTNAGKVLRVTPKTYDEKCCDIAIEAVRSLDLEFGGVDILIDKRQGPLVTEVNFPCFFPRCQNITGVDIAGKMVDYLVEKTSHSATVG